MLRTVVLLLCGLLATHFAQAKTFQSKAIPLRGLWGPTNGQIPNTPKFTDVKRAYGERGWTVGERDIAGQHKMERWQQTARGKRHETMVVDVTGDGRLVSVPHYALTVEKPARGNTPAYVLNRKLVYDHPTVMLQTTITTSGFELKSVAALKQKGWKKPQRWKLSALPLGEIATTIAMTDPNNKDLHWEITSSRQGLSRDNGSYKVRLLGHQLITPTISTYVTQKGAPRYSVSMVDPASGQKLITGPEGELTQSIGHVTWVANMLFSGHSVPQLLNKAVPQHVAKLLDALKGARSVD
ncbi:MAG: hypothetical protein H6707_09225 [Deltaproteobacteria bacterium]|nr:hypothetical protein [Deltaproteobacteria bacterium]